MQRSYNEATTYLSRIRTKTQYVTLYFVTEYVIDRCAAFSYVLDSLHLRSHDTSCFVLLRHATLFFDVLCSSALLIRYNTFRYVNIRYVWCND